MDAVRRAELEWLMREHLPPCVSIFMPTHRATQQIRQGPIRLKNLLKEAERRLKQRGLRGAEIHALLEPAEALMEDPFFWRHQGDGLALYLSPDSQRSFRVPIELEELMFTGEHFHVSPLLPLLIEGGLFYILALSQKEIRILQGTPHSVSELHLDGVPESIWEALGTEAGEKQLQFHTGTPMVGGRRAAIFHGHGQDEDSKDRTLQYFRKVDDALRHILKGGTAPMVPAGVERIVALYREANGYPNLTDGSVAGNPASLHPQELHQKAWKIVEPHFRAELEKALARYAELAGTGRTSNDLSSILPSAHQGRVEVLFVLRGAHRWGEFDPVTAELHLGAGTPEPGEEDLVDLAAVKTLLHGGAVYPLDQGEVPEGSEIAAILRF